jgi:hypothetical protein
LAKWGPWGCNTFFDYVTTSQNRGAQLPTVRVELDEILVATCGKCRLSAHAQRSATAAGESALDHGNGETR